jgi:predicted flap endonuclease-1-like 5' DNA nuclease
MPHGARLISPDTGEELDVAIDLTEDGLRVSVGEAVVGEWPSDEIRLAARPGGEYLLTVEGERWIVQPADPIGFGAGHNVVPPPPPSPPARRVPSLLGSALPPSRLWLPLSMALALVVAFGLGLVVGRSYVDSNNPVMWMLLVLVFAAGFGAAREAITRLDEVPRRGSSVVTEDMPPFEKGGSAADGQSSPRPVAPHLLGTDESAFRGVRRTTAGDHDLVEGILRPRLDAHATASFSHRPAEMDPLRSAREGTMSSRRPPARPNDLPVTLELGGIVARSGRSPSFSAGDREQRSEGGGSAVNVAGAERPVDDLTTIKGIGPTIAEVLLGMGITTYAQLASLTDEQVERVQQALGRFPDRIHRDDWRGSAEQAYRAKYGQP